MLIFLGDVHEAWGDAVDRVLRLAPAEEAIAIQVGDWGWHPDDSPIDLPFPVHFVDGNHDHQPSLQALTEPTELQPNLIYHPRGTFAEIAGKRFAFLGGAQTQYRKELRRPGIDFWPELEKIRTDDVERLRSGWDAEPVDYLITHVPPEPVARRMGIGSTTLSHLHVQAAWNALGKPALVCGHHHRFFRHSNVVALPFLGAWTEAELEGRDSVSILET